MERQTGKRAGFSLTEAILTIVTVGALAGTSWAVYQHIKSSATTTGAAPNSSQSSAQQTTTPTSPAPAVAFLDVKEWGIKLPLSASIKDAYYVPSNSNVDPNGLPLAMWLGLASLADASCNPASNNSGSRGAIGELMRITPGETDGVTGQPLAQEYPDGVMINGYYYAYKSWASGNPCVSQTGVQSADSAFAAAAKGQVPATATN